MIPNTTPYYVFIRLAIWALRAVTPASTVYCLGRILGYIPPLPWPVEILACLEVFFYFFVSLPKQRALNRSRPIAIHRTREERQELFERCWASIPDLEQFLSVWFKGESLESIHRQDFKDYLAWGFLYKTKASAEDDDELEGYVQRTEKLLGRSFPPGHGPSRPSQVSTDDLRLQHKPLLFYVFAIGADDLMTYVTGRFIGLRHVRLPLDKFFTVFPFRPYTLFDQYVSPSEELSYWYRPHTSKKEKPVLFIHGIGAGMRTYTGFLNDFMRDTQHDDDGQVGIIALELMPISMRVTKGILPKTKMVQEILKILDHHGWDKFVIVGHSYGSIIATHLLQFLHHTERVGPMLLVDPVTLSIHWGGIPYNFLYRHPQKASEWQLHYFASTDMLNAHSITRRFDWSENVLWKDDMKGRDITIVLADGDIIMDNATLRKYLTDDEDLNTVVYDTRDKSIDTSKRNGQGVDVLWYTGLNHAEVWDNAKDWRFLVEILERYCRSSGNKSKVPGMDEYLKRKQGLNQKS